MKKILLLAIAIMVIIAGCKKPEAVKPGDPGNKKKTVILKGVNKFVPALKPYVYAPMNSISVTTDITDERYTVNSGDSVILTGLDAEKWIGKKVHSEPSIIVNEINGPRGYNLTYTPCEAPYGGSRATIKEGLNYFEFTVIVTY